MLNFIRDFQRVFQKAASFPASFFAGVGVVAVVVVEAIKLVYLFI